jgi:hypothetical protein
MNSLQAVSWLAAGVGVLIAALKYRTDSRVSREQQSRELRWKQAQAGKSLNDEMQGDPWAWPALEMLDYPGEEFEIAPGQRTRITHDDLLVALDPTFDATDPKHIYMRKCFDTLFYFMAMLEHNISSTLILSDDVSFPLDYYIPILAGFREQVDAYVKNYGLTRTNAFLHRYPQWSR